jgi:hypothetical protein
MTDLNHIISIKSGYVLVEEPANFEVIWKKQKSRLREISAACLEGNTKKVLVIGTATKVHLSMTELLMLAREISKLELKAALVVSNDISSEMKPLFEEISTNRGSPIQFFEKEKDARAWLEV